MYESICNVCPKKEGCTQQMIGDVEIVDGEEVIPICEMSYNMILNLFG